MVNNISGRISFLDGMRGIAILLVVLFHAYARWPKLVSYGDTFSRFPLFAYGWLGVNLFFMISGFVILMTLEKCFNFREFIMRRWLRLFPAMLMCTFIILVTIPLFPERPAGAVVCRDVLPGLTFIQPYFWSMLFGSTVNGLEAAFWSLYVEVKFYIFFGVIYFSAGWRKAVFALISLFIISIAIMLAGKVVPNSSLIFAERVSSFIGANHFGWFTSGALYYKYFGEKKQSTFVVANMFAVLSALVVGGSNWHAKIAAILVVVFFSFCITNLTVKRVVSNPLLIFLGFVSYPLYLIHENMMVAMIIKIGAHFPWMPLILIPIVPILAVIGLGWIVASYCEPWIKSQLRSPVQRFFTLNGATRKV